MFVDRIVIRASILFAASIWSGLLPAQSEVISRNVTSDHGNLSLSIAVIERETSKRDPTDGSLSMMERIEARMEFADRNGTRISVEARLDEGIASATYDLSTGSFSLTVPQPGKLVRLKVLDASRSRVLFDGTIESSCGPDQMDARQSLNALLTPDVKTAFDSLARTVESQHLVPTELRDLYWSGSSRNLAGWACGLLLAGFEAGAIGAVVSCAGCQPSTGGAGCLPCLGWITSTLGLGGSAAAACDVYLDNQGAGSAGGGSSGQVTCFELDDGSIWCVDADGDVVEFSPP